MSGIAWQVHAALATEPAVVETSSLETLEQEFDASALLAVGETVTAAKTRLVDLTTGNPVGLRAPTLTSPIVTQVLAGLTRGHDYELSWALTVSATKKPVRLTIVRCVA